MKTRVGGRRGRLLSVVATAALAGAATLATATPASANSGDLSNRLPIIGSVRVSATWAHPAGEPYGHTTGDGGTGSASPAIDFAPSSAAPTSTPVVSSGNGLVVGTGYQYPGAGHWISVYHAGDNRTSSYLHLAAAPLVAKGSRVAAGQRLGTMGGSGGVATHLHYQEKAGSISTTPTRDNRLDPGVLTGCTSGPLNFQNWRGRYNFSVSNYFRSCPSATVTGFSSNASRLADRRLGPQPAAHRLLEQPRRAEGHRPHDPSRSRLRPAHPLSDRDVRDVHRSRGHRRGALRRDLLHEGRDEPDPEPVVELLVRGADQPARAVRQPDRSLTDGLHGTGPREACATSARLPGWPVRVRSARPTVCAGRHTPSGLEDVGCVRHTGTAHAQVAERQTRCVQVAVSERAWGFKSPLRTCGRFREI